jgi:hypothetical protein
MRPEFVDDHEQQKKDGLVEKGQDYKIILTRFRKGF